MKIFRLFVAFTLICFALSPKLQAVTPPPDGGYPGQNTAEGQSALNSLLNGERNTGIGYKALFSNTSGDSNTAVGAAALRENEDGEDNTAIGDSALVHNDGDDNTAIGFAALSANTAGGKNTAIGVAALRLNSTGNSNIALGFRAGLNTTGDHNIDIGNDGVAGQSDTIRIGEKGVQTATFIAGIDESSVSGSAVFVNSAGRLGTLPSSQRFKDNIRPMGKLSEVLFALEPVTFQYKKELDPAGGSQFGLVAEQVEKVDPDLVARDSNGKPYTVRYDQVNAMLLNEFLKEHKKLEQQQATITDLKSTVAQQQKQIAALTVGLQKVSAQLEVNKHAPQTVVNNQ
jgi:Chaperone of endosialidase